jgi:hypothetical protein
MNSTKDKLNLARTRVQNLLTEQEKIIAQLNDDLGLKNTSALLARQYICSESSEVWLEKTLDQLMFLINNPN